MKTEPVKRLFLITGTTRGIGKALLRESLEQPQSFVVSFSRSAACLKGRHQNIFIDLNDSANLASVFDAIRLDARQLPNILKRWC
jgi:short-subunit dehydrogenase